MRKVQVAKKKRKYKIPSNNLRLFKDFLTSDIDCMAIDYSSYASLKSCVESIRISIKRYKYNGIIAIHQYKNIVYLSKGRML